MQSYKAEFIEFAIDRRVLMFGEFTLKSGRKSPYFFNSGLFNSGACLARLGSYYASAIAASGVEFDLLYGPAYKGIPLVAAVATQFSNDRNLDIPYSFNRKEAKDHGEGGMIVGAPLAGRVLIVDDVISAGTSTRESVSIINNAGAQPIGVAIALDRQERGQGTLSSVQEVASTLGLTVISIATLTDVIEYLQMSGQYMSELERMQLYRREYGVD
ncbi:MAG: orotate phosphoribosyltransferase [Gammaproteobacteria bacterium]|nr:orotate phosphoribosyltransferase [Gammaproteobacteria bacterium]